MSTKKRPDAYEHDMDKMFGGLKRGDMFWCDEADPFKERIFLVMEPPTASTVVVIEMTQENRERILGNIPCETQRIKLGVDIDFFNRMRL